MGYRYGERRYSEGLYSRWPDWWHDKTCVNDAWAAQECRPPLWLASAPALPPWAPAVRRKGVLEPFKPAVPP